MSMNCSAVSKLIISAHDDLDTMSGRGFLDLDVASKLWNIAGCVGLAFGGGIALRRHIRNSLSSCLSLAGCVNTQKFRLVEGRLCADDVDEAVCRTMLCANCMQSHKA